MTLTWKHCNLPNKMIWLQITVTTKYQRMNKKHKQIHSEIKIHNKRLKNINKIEKYKQLNMTEHKTDMNITKIGKYQKLNRNSMTKHKTDMNVSKIEKCEKTKHHGSQNRHEHY